MSGMVSILAHRGWWVEPKEKNTYGAVKRALEAGYGIEIDIRDRNERLYVAHDVVDTGTYEFSDLYPLFEKFPDLCIALNLKSCGLQSLLKQVKQLKTYFAFDMAIPDLMVNIKENITSYTRISEIEKEAVLYNKVQGVWIDMFTSEWATANVIATHLKAGKDVALVSPELHRRAYKDYWAHLRDNLVKIGTHGKKLYLCTDFPAEADAFFNG